MSTESVKQMYLNVEKKKKQKKLSTTFKMILI